MEDFIDSDVWVSMIEKQLNGKNSRRFAEINFWVETRELTDRQGNVVYQHFPRLAISFK